MKKIAFFLVFLCSIGIQALNAQPRQITGTVTSAEDGLGIPGASVLVKGTTIGTTTNIDGEYSINVPEDATMLYFSFVGMKSQEIAIDGKTVINVVLAAEAIGMDEVVVTALGITKAKKALGYSVTDLKADELEKAAEANVIQSLAGKVAGVQVVGSGGTPGASSKIVIRGASTFSGNTQPLIVVDGVPIDNSTVQSTAGDNPFNKDLEGVNNSNRALDLNPEDIESVSVLKGPAAAALYGTKAGNGVIIYTTKRGKKGKGLGVSVNFSTEFNKVNKLPKLQKTYGQGIGGEFITADPGPDNRFFTADDLDYGTSSSWGPKITGTAYDNPDNFFQTGVSYNTNVAIMGGNEKGSFRLSVGNSDQEGMVPNSEFKRTSVRITGDIKVHEDVKIGGTANYVHSEGIKVQNGSNLAGIMLGLLRAPASFDIRNWRYDNGFQRTYFAFYDNPFFTANKNEFTDNVNRILGNVYVSYTGLPWLNVTYRVGVDAYSDHRQQNFAVSSLGGDNGDGLGQVNYNDLTNRNVYSDLIFTGSLDLTDDFKFGYTAGNNIEATYFTDNFARGKILAIPDFYNLDNASERYASNDTREVFSTAIFGQVDLEYQGMLFLSLTGRNEWASTFGEDDRSFFYPSATLSWLANESFDLPTWISFAKLRLAYAEVGIFPQAYNTKTYFTSPIITDGFTNGLSFPYGNVNGFGYESSLGNATLKPERKIGTEIGLKVNMWGRVDLDFTYYNEKTKDILLFKPIAPSSGFSSEYTNAGELVNRGIEVQLGVDVYKNSEFNWNVTANWSRNRNEVKKLAEGVDQISIESAFTSIGSYAIVGQPVGVFFGTKWERDASGNLIIGSNGIPLKAAEQGKVGDPNPDWTGGLRNTFTWKGFTLSGLLDFRHGGDMWNGTFARLNNLGRTKISADRERDYVIPGVKQDGTPNDIAVSATDYYKKFVGDAGGAAEQFVESVNWIRLRDVSLSYRFTPEKFQFLKNMDFIQNIELSFTGRNLWLETNYDGVDPETSLTGAGSNIGGFDYFNNPGSKSYLFGIKVNF
ncbi:MAG: SusC/RagA family TonB-linked outer membrane protein [Marinifilaceae bacterium]